ncbi:MAG: zf-HC2 domain-containing protein [bacterium]|nr:zf-HC2 domain-containing protein [bacterium]
MSNNGMNNNESMIQATCEGFLELLPLYEGGELELKKADRLREHLESCATCNAQWVVGKRAIRMRQEAWALQAGDTPDLWPGIQARLRSEGCVRGETPEPVATGGVLLRFPVLRYAAAAAALLGVLALGTKFLASDNVIAPIPNGTALVADGGQEQAQPTNPTSAPVVEKPTAANGRLRLMAPGESSVLDEAPQWGLEEAPAGNWPRRAEFMQVAGGR